MSRRLIIGLIRIKSGVDVVIKLIDLWVGMRLGGIVPAAATVIRGKTKFDSNGQFGIW